MKDASFLSMETALRDLDDGAFVIDRRHGCGGAQPPLTEHLRVQSQGKGRIESFSIFPGIEVSFHQYLAHQVSFHHPALRPVLEIHHCRLGRIGWNMRGGVAVYLGEGDLCLHSMCCCADSEMTLPLGYYEGIAIAMDLEKLARHPVPIMKEAGVDAKRLYETLCAGDKPYAIPSCREIDRIFSVLYGLDEPLRIPYYKLKAQEMLLFLSQWDAEKHIEGNRYPSQQTELIKEIHQELVGHLDRRITIEELSRKYLLNTSTLKSVFKAVYGLPIATYMKQRRIERAAELLRTTGASIADIAQQVGYETQGKFTKAFKERMDMLPTQYRRRYQ